MIVNMGETYLVLNSSFNTEEDAQFEESKSLSEFLNSARKSTSNVSVNVNASRYKRLRIKVFGSNGHTFTYD